MGRPVSLQVGVWVENKNQKWGRRKMGGSGRVGVNNEREMRKNGAKKWGRRKICTGSQLWGV